MKRPGLVLLLSFLAAGGAVLFAAENPGKPQGTAAPTLAQEDTPRDATGRCADGTWTTAKNRQGACSEHGGIGTWFGKPPKGATSRCRDGSFSKGKKHQGACSGHGGVWFWLQKAPAGAQPDASPSP